MNRVCKDRDFLIAQCIKNYISHIALVSRCSKEAIGAAMMMGIAIGEDVISEKSDIRGVIRERG